MRGTPGSLRRLVINGSIVEMAGYGTGQLVRFTGNLILSRLLSPQAFGLMALVNIVNQGLVMFSDAGLHAAVIQSDRGEDTRFLNTIFTWQAVRGVLLWCVAALLALPLSLLYHEPRLRALIYAGAASVIILGFHSTSLYTLRRRLKLSSIVLVEVSAQVVAVVCMLLWALRAPSVWALLVGTLASATVTTLLSHCLRVGYRNRFQWDRASAKAAFEFGKWLAGSSMLTFISQQGDRLVLGELLGTTRLGIYSMAVLLSGACGDAISRLSSGVLFPAYSRAYEQGGPRLAEVYVKSRRMLDSLVMPALGALSVLGTVIVHFLYDPRYAEAGWMLEVLAVRVALGAIVSPAQFCLFAMGKTRYGFFLNLARSLWLVTALPLGFHFGGVRGLVWSVALGEVPAVIVVLRPIARYVRLERELLAPLLFAGGALLGLGVRLALRQLGVAV